jgi:hypothetical protein
MAATCPDSLQLLAMMDIGLPSPPVDGRSHPFELAIASPTSPHAARAHADALAAKALAHRRSDPTIQGWMARPRARHRIGPATSCDMPAAAMLALYPGSSAILLVQSSTVEDLAMFFFLRKDCKAYAP